MAPPLVTVVEDPLSWARSLRDREGRGERLTLLQREKWRQALRNEGA